jgi:hypothetical protein
MVWWGVEGHRLQREREPEHAAPLRGLGAGAMGTSQVRYSRHRPGPHDSRTKLEDIATSCRSVHVTFPPYRSSQAAMRRPP